MQDTAALLRIARVGARLSQRAVARKARVSQSTISRLEAGKKRGADPKLARRIARALGLHPGVLALDVVNTDARRNG